MLVDSNFAEEPLCGSVQVAPSAVSMAKLLCGQQHARNERLLNLRKLKSRNAARSRRGKENIEFYELAKLLPIPPELSSQLDKASVIKLTMCFMKIREFCLCNLPKWKLSNDGPPPNRTVKDTSSSASLSQEQIVMSKFIGSQVGSQILQSLGGFILVLNCNGQLLYVSETVSVLLGLSQVEMIGSGILDYVYPEDRNELAVHLCQNLSEHLAGESKLQRGFSRDDFVKSLYIRMKSNLAKKGISPKSSSYKVVRICTRLAIFHSDIKQFSCKGRKGGDLLSDIKTSASNHLGIIAFGSTLPMDELVGGALYQNNLVMRVNASLQFTYCESKVGKLLGYDTREVVGRSLYQCIHAADAKGIKKCHTDLLAKGSIETPYFRWLHKSGGFKWVYATVFRVPNQRLYPEQSFVWILTVISELLDKNQVLNLNQKSSLGLESLNTGGKQFVIGHTGSSKDNTEVYRNQDVMSVKPVNFDVEAHRLSLAAKRTNSTIEGLQEVCTSETSTDDVAKNKKEAEDVESIDNEDDVGPVNIKTQETKELHPGSEESGYTGQGNLGKEKVDAKCLPVEASHNNGIRLYCMAQELAHHLKQQSALRYADFISEYMDIDSNHWSNPPNKEISNHNDLPPDIKKMHGVLPKCHTPSVVHHHYPLDITSNLRHSRPLIAKIMATQWHGVHKLANAGTFVVTTPVTIMPSYCIPNLANQTETTMDVSSVSIQTPASVATTLEELRKDPLHKLNPPNKVVPKLSESAVFESQQPRSSALLSTSSSQEAIDEARKMKVGVLDAKFVTGCEPIMNPCLHRVQDHTIFQVPSTVLFPANGMLTNSTDSTVIALSPSSSLQFPMTSGPARQHMSSLRFPTPSAPIQQHLGSCIVQPLTFSSVAAVRTVQF